MKNRRTILILAVIACLALMVLAVRQSSPQAVRERISIQFREDVWGVYGADIIMYSDYKSTQKLKLYGDSGNIDGEGTLDVAGAGTIGGQMSIGTWGLLTPQTVITLTQGATLSPTGTYQPLDAASSVSTGSITAGSAGQLLVLINTSASYTITITDTGTLKLSGNAVLGPGNDNLTLISDGTNWIETAQADL